MSPDDPLSAGVGRRLGYLLKHAHLELESRTDAVLAPYGLDSRQLGILLAIAGDGAPSQHHVAEALGIDRTTMVARLDQLEAQGIVARRPDPADRRRNVVELTNAGSKVVRDAVGVSDAAEREWLSNLSSAESAQLRRILTRVVPPPPAPQPPITAARVPRGEA